jgi:hypothetical protein
MIWQELRSQIQQVQLNLDTAVSRMARAETAGGVAQSVLADAPLAAVGGVGPGDMLWITDGRKPGEGAGAGTGVLAVYDSITDSWLDVYGYTAVTI